MRGDPLLRIGHNSLHADRAARPRTAPADAGVRARGKAVYQVEAHTGRLTEWLYAEGLLDLPDDDTEASREAIGTGAGSLHCAKIKSWPATAAPLNLCP